MGFVDTLKRIQFHLNGRIVHLRRKGGRKKGDVLMCYFTAPFLVPGGKWLGGHTNYWEACTIAEEFTGRGYDVDVVDFDNAAFLPKKPYSFIIDAHGNLERFAPLLPKTCVKVLLTMTSHWLFNNTEEYKRLHDIFLRRGEIFFPERLLSPTRAERYADYVTYGTDHKLSTYNLPRGTKTFFIPISTTYTFPAPDKEYSSARNGFVWLGGAGVIHKGLDLLVESFAQTPSCTLEICGKHKEPLFETTYEKELAQDNIHGHGMVDLGSDTFKKIREKSAFIISVSCAEGHSGAVIVGMHAGLIPIVNKESGIDTQDFGFTLPDSSPLSIEKMIRECAALPPSELAVRAKKAWEYANAHHTREIFSSRFREFADLLEAGRATASK